MRGKGLTKFESASCKRRKQVLSDSWNNSHVQPVKVQNAFCPTNTQSWGYCTSRVRFPYFADHLTC